MSEDVDIWKESLQANEQRAKIERTIIITGHQDSGKSTIASFVSGNKPSTDKRPTYIIDYMYGRINLTTGEKAIFNIYEIGDCKDSALVMDSIATKITNNFVLIITISLEEPGKAYEKLLQELDKLNDYIEKYNKM